MNENEARSTLDGFRKTVISLRQLHSAWSSLFFNEPAIITSKPDQPAKSILAILANLLTEKLILEIAKLGDKPKVKGKTTLCLRTVLEAANVLGINCEKHSDTMADFESAKQIVESEWLIKMRHNALAHNNYQVYIGECEPLKINYRQIDEGVKSLARFETRLRRLAAGTPVSSSSLDPTEGCIPLDTELGNIRHDAAEFRRIIKDSSR